MPPRILVVDDVRVVREGLRSLLAVSHLEICGEAENGQQAVDQVHIGHKLAVKVDAYKDQSFTGEVSAINPKVDVSNRNVQIRALLKNPDHKLLPGMYATVDITVGEPATYVTLPQTAITYNPYGDTVYVVESKGNDAQGTHK